MAPDATIRRENAALQMRLEEAEETLRAIRGGDVDALVIEGTSGPQVYTLQGHDAEANRFRGEMLAQVSDAVLAIDGDQSIVYLNAAAERLYGFTLAQALGRRMSDIFETRWEMPADEQAAIGGLESDGEWRGEAVHVLHDGRMLHVDIGVTRLRKANGAPNGVLAVIRDVTERKQHELAVLVSEIRYRRLFETAHDGILILDPATRKIVDANPFMTQMLGYSRAELVGRELFEIGLLQDEAASQEMVRRLNLTRQVRYDNLPLESQSGRHQDVEVVANLYDENGHPVIQCNIRDITERRRNEDHVKLLMAEVNHRAKNLLAVVQAVADQTAKYGDPATFGARLSDRIAGIAAGQDLLVRNLWQGVEVTDLVRVQLAHFHELIGTRVHIDGPAARLSAAAAQGIGMAIHELATNAAKYGALSNRDGQVHIAWSLSTSTPPQFAMSWRETGGPPVVLPIRKGFGQIVVGRMVEAAIEGKVITEFATSGFHWSLTAPAAATLASAEPGT